ncbi:MAG TPA: Holliday junction resolvase-like protein [Candidatus Thermoplasmatota archaeon]|nr:Holliday junction resolvase-like protein [Candidatus Thermoplasmatota archaeon]
MDPLLYLTMMVIALVLALVIVVRVYHDKVARLEERLASVESSKQSLSTVYGRITEQWAPFMAGYPHDPRQFRFLGSPIDGVQFEEDKIVFVEFKANGSQLTPRQAAIKRLVQDGRIEWLEFRLSERAGTSVAAPARSHDIERWGAEREPPSW